MRQGNKNGFDYNFLWDYLPSRYEATEEQASVRRLVFNFKDGKYLPVLQTLLSGLRENLPTTWLNNSNTLVCCIPASTHVKNANRFEYFCARLAQDLGVINGYDAIGVLQDHDAGHLGTKPANVLPYLSFNSNKIRDKRILLVDDVITRGKSFYQVADHLQSLGASSVRGVFVAKTINPDWRP